MMPTSPESVAASTHNNGDTKAIQKDKQNPRPFLEFIKSTAPLSHNCLRDKLNSTDDQRKNHQGQVGQSSETLSYEKPDSCLQHRPPMPGTPRLTVESPSSESDTMDRGFSRLSMNSSSDDCSSYYSDSCAIEREPRKTEAEHSDGPVLRGLAGPFETVNSVQQQSNASRHGSCLTLRRLSRVDPRGDFNLRQGAEISCFEYDGDDEGKIRTKERLVGSVGVNIGSRIN